MSTADVESSPGLPDYLLSPNAVLSDTAQWRYGKAPDYSNTRKVFAETKHSSHPAGSLPQLVENLVKNWEIEASHKTSLSDWRTVDRGNYSFSVNGGKDQTGEHMLEVGTYNAIISSPNEFYDGKTMGFDGSHKVFKGMMKSFAWEVLEVYSELPRVAFKWRHWGTMSGDYVGVNGKGEKVTVKAHGGPIDIQGISIATVDYQARIQKVETWFDPLEMFRQIAPDGIVTREKIIPQLDGNEAPWSNNESSQSEQNPASSEEEAAKQRDQQGTATIETPRPAAEAVDETKNLKLAEESVDMTEKAKPAVETDLAADPSKQFSTDQLNVSDQQLATELSSSLQSDQKDVIATGTTTELTELPASSELNHQVHEETLATTSVPEPNQPATPTLQSKIEPQVQPLESGASAITLSNDATNNNSQAELNPHLDDKSIQQQEQEQQQQQHQEVDHSGQPPPPTNSILSEREVAKPEETPSQIIPSPLEERLRKLEARLARLEFVERFVVDSGESEKSADAGASAGPQGNVAGATLENVKEEKEDTIQVKRDAHDDEEEEKEKEKSRTATRITGNEFSPVAAVVAGAGCPFLNRG